jgi:hypothetical protein
MFSGILIFPFTHNGFKTFTCLHQEQVIITGLCKVNHILSLMLFYQSYLMTLFKTCTMMCRLYDVTCTMMASDFWIWCDTQQIAFFPSYLPGLHVWVGSIEHQRIIFFPSINSVDLEVKINKYACRVSWPIDMSSLTIRVHKLFGNPTSLLNVQIIVDSNYGSKIISQSALLSTNLRPVRRHRAATSPT